MSKKIIAISGSLRDASYNTALLKAVQTLAPEGVTIDILAIHDLPFFSQDAEGNVAQSVKDFKAVIEGADAVIFATPEYNRSIPGVLKNAIDWASRPYGANSFAGKPVLILGATPSPTGTMAAQQHLRTILSYLDMHIIGQPEFYLSNAHDKFDATGILTDEATKTHLKAALEVLVSRLA